MKAVTDKPLTNLYDDLRAAESALNCLGAQNTVGLTPSARVSLDVEYERAKNRYAEAYKAYHTAVFKTAR